MIVERLARNAPDDANAQVGMANSIFYIFLLLFQRTNVFNHKMYRIIDDNAERQAKDN